MCLYSKRKRPKIAKKDIHCYKWVSIIDGKLYSPFFRHECQFGLNYPENEPNLNLSCQYYRRTNLFKVKGIRYKVDKGFIHSFKLVKKSTIYKDLINVASSHVMHRFCAVFEAIIPKGSKYYEDEQSYASDKLFIVYKPYSIINEKKICE